MSIPEGLPSLLQLLFVLLAHILRAGAKAVLHVPLGFLDPTLNLGDGEVMLTGHFNGRGLALEYVYYHR